MRIEILSLEMKRLFFKLTWSNLDMEGSIGMSLLSGVILFLEKDIWKNI